MKKRMITAILPLALLLTNCAKTTSQSSMIPITESNATNTVTNETISNTQTKLISSETGTTPLSEDINNAAFRYYSDLDKALTEKHSVYFSTPAYHSGEFHMIGIDGNLYFEYQAKIYCFDMKQHQLKTIYKSDYSEFSQLFYRDGYFYIQESSPIRGKKTGLKVIDQTGNAIRSEYDPGCLFYVSYVCENGSIVIEKHSASYRLDDSDRTITYHVLTPKGVKYHEGEAISLPTIPVEHGFEKELKFQFGGSYGFGFGNRIYVETDDEKWFYYDTETQLWTHSKIGKDDVRGYERRLIGNYLICSFNNGKDTTGRCTIYDLLSEEKVAVIPCPYEISYFPKEFNFFEYFGDECNYVYQNSSNYWLKVRLPNISADNSVESIPSDKLGRDDSYGSMYRLNNEIYLFIDEYGWFLRTYEKGNSEEIPVMTFKRN